MRINNVFASRGGIGTSFANAIRGVADRIDVAAKPLYERLENACMDVLSGDPGARMIMQNVEMLFPDLPKNSLYIAPMFDEQTYTIKSYSLCYDGTPIVQANDYKALLAKIRMYVLSDKELDIKEFAGLVEMALKAPKR